MLFCYHFANAFYPITPEAKPSNVFCTRTDISSFMKSTKAEPSVVSSSGISSPVINVIVIFFSYLAVQVIY